MSSSSNPLQKRPGRSDWKGRRQCMQVCAQVGASMMSSCTICVSKEQFQESMPPTKQTKVHRPTMCLIPSMARPAIDLFCICVAKVCSSIIKAQREKP